MDGKLALKPGLFLDLDGTIQRSASGNQFISGPEDVALYLGVEAKLWQYRDEGYLIAGLTNQGGVAYGYKTTKGFQAELDAMIALFQRNPFHCVTRCYSHEGGSVEPFNHRSLLRKPDIGMLAIIEGESLERGWVIDWDNSIMVGDRPEDYECANRAGIQFQWAWDFFGLERPESASVYNGTAWVRWDADILDRDLYGHS